MLESEFTQDFAIAKADPGIARAAVIESVEGGMPAALVRSVPQPDRTAVAIAFEAIMNHANKTADLYSAFLAPHEDVLKPLVAAADRGVRVRLLVPGREHVDKPVSALTAESAFPVLLEAGVEIHRYRPTMLHAKATVIDDHLVAFGTPNLNGRSFQRDRELMIVAEDEDLAEDLASRFEQDLEESDEAVSPRPSSLPGRLGRYAFDRLTHLVSGHV
jgi:cardiolipin synthase